MNKTFKSLKYTALFASLINLGHCSDVVDSEGSSEFGSGSFSSHRGDYYDDIDEKSKEKSDAEAVQKIFEKAEKERREIDYITEIVIDEKGNMLPAAMTREMRDLQRNTKKRIKKFIEENLRVEDGRNLAIQLIDTLPVIDSLPEKDVVGILNDISSKDPSKISKCLTALKDVIWTKVSSDIGSEDIIKKLITIYAINDVQYNDIRKLLKNVQSDFYKHNIVDKLINIPADQRNALFQHYQEISQFIDLVQSDVYKYNIVDKLINIPADQRNALFQHYQEISQFIDLVQSDFYKYNILERLIRLPVDECLGRIARATAEMDRLDMNNIQDRHIVVLIETPLDQPLRNILNDNMAGNHGHGVNIHSGDRDDRSTQAMALLLDAQKDLTINWEEQFNDFEQNIDVVLDIVIQDTQLRLKEAELHRESYENVIKKRTADKVRVKQVLGMGGVQRVDGFGSLLSARISGYGLRDMHPKEFLGRFWYFASHTEDSLNAKISLMTVIADSIEGNDHLVCNPGKMQRMIVAVLQGRLKGVNIDGIGVPSPLNDADKTLIDQIIMNLQKNSGDINVGQGVRLVKEKTPTMHNDDIKEYIKLRKGQIAHLKSLEILNKQHKSQKILEDLKQQYLAENQEVANDSFLRESFEMIAQDGSLSLTKSAFDAFISQFEEDEKQAKTATALMTFVRVYLSNNKDVDPDEFRGYANDYSDTHFKR
jgi:hypothetical protein